MPNFRVVLDGEGSTFYSGSTVRGHVLFDLTKAKKFERIFVEVIGVASTKLEEILKCCADYKEVDTLVHVVETLWSSRGTADGKLAPGAHRWAFRLTLPEHATSSFQGSKGQVYYYLQARAKAGGMAALFMSDRLAKLAIRVEQVHRYESGRLQLPRTEEVQKSVCCWPCRSGSVVMTVTLPKTAFVSGEQFTMNVSLQNESNRRVRLKAFLRKSTIFTAEGHSATVQWTLLSLVSNPIPAHTTRDWNPSDEIPSGNIVDCRLIKHHYVFVICATILGAGKLSVVIPIKVGFVRPRSQNDETEESVPLTNQPVIHPTDNESGAPLTMTTQFAASNPFPPQHGVVPSAPYPEASDPLSYQSGVVPSAPYPAASNPLPYQSGVTPSEFESDNQPPLRPAIYDPPPPYSSLADLNSPHLQ